MLQAIILKISCYVGLTLCGMNYLQMCSILVKKLILMLKTLSLNEIFLNLTCQNIYDLNWVSVRGLLPSFPRNCCKYQRFEIKIIIIIIIIGISGLTSAFSAIFRVFFGYLWP